MKKVYLIVVLFYVSSSVSIVFAQIKIPDKKIENAVNNVSQMTSKSDLDKYYDKNLQPVLDPETGRYRDSEWLDVKHSNRFQAGVGIPAITFNADSKNIGFLDSSVNMMFGFRFIQKVWIDWTVLPPSEAADLVKFKRNDHKISWWDISGGFIFNKPQDDNTINFGFMFLPWGMTFDDYSIAAGCSYVFPGKVEWKRKNCNMIIAVTMNLLQSNANE